MNFNIHIKKALAINFVSAFFFSGSFAQNLVPNGSFEVLDSCHFVLNGNSSAVNYAPPWDGTINNGTPDIYLTCNGTVPTSMAFGYQAAQDGGNYIGIISYEKFLEEREYLSTVLSDTLKAGQGYYVGFYVSLANRYSDYEVRSMGAYLTDTLIYNGASFGVMPFPPQVMNYSSASLKDTMNWVLVADTIFAVGNERYLAVGNFFDDANCQAILTGWNDPIHDSTAYYYIDNVFVYEIPGLTGIKQKENFRIDIYPNPNSGLFTISSSIPFKEEELQIFDINGKLVGSYSFKGQKTSLTLTELKDGVYFYTIVQEGNLLKRDKVIIIK
jgi:hypothetical protein